ncbi:hypothetical protein F0250_08240 [Vibrio cyclitrophicus]|nr:hypothetical protein [Vibrio cyclitrophicus]
MSILSGEDHSQRLVFSLRSSIAKRRSHLKRALDLRSCYQQITSVGGSVSRIYRTWHPSKFRILL